MSKFAHPVRRRGGARAPRGAIAVLAAIWLAVAIAALGALDVGNVYLARRQYQRTADLAAIAGAQAIGSALGSAAACAAATSAAQSIATANGLPADATVSVACGRWDTPAAGAAPVFSAAGLPLNAVQVDVARRIPFLFVGPAHNVTAEATAKAVDVGTFTLATSTATLSGGMLNGLLNSLLGTNLSLGVVTYQNLAAAQVKLGDLATALHFGTIDELLNANVRLADLASAMITALGAGGTASADVTSALGAIAATVSTNLNVNLGNTANTSGLLAIGLSSPQGAQSASISVLDTLVVAAEIANGKSAIDLTPALNLGALANVSARAVVIQPPVLAVGEAGQDASGAWRTSAHAAQVRVYLNVSLVNLNLGPLAQVSVLNLPLYVEAGGQGTAYLQSTQCTTSKSTSRSTIVVQPGLASVCVGGDVAAANVANNTVPVSCTQPAKLTNVTLASLQVVGISVGNFSPPSGLSIPLQAAAPSTLTFNAVAGDSDDYQSTDTNALGSATASLLTSVVAQLPSALYVTVLGINIRVGDTGLLAQLLTGVVNGLTPVLNSLDGLLVPLLQLLGVQIGVSTVHDIALSCGEAQLVN